MPQLKVARFPWNGEEAGAERTIFPWIREMSVSWNSRQTSVFVVWRQRVWTRFMG